MGWSVILLTAPENKNLAREETIKISSRKIALRVITLYCLCIFTVGLNVPYQDTQLRKLAEDDGIKGGHFSVFVLAAIREHVPVLPHFLNGFFVFSATTTGINSLYGASRLLHAIATLPDAWPRWGWTESIRTRLEQTRHGVPMNAVIVSWLVSFIAFLSTRDDSAKVLERMTTFSASCSLIVYALNCVTFLLFFKELDQIACGFRDRELAITPETRFQFNRSAKLQYPYRSHLQWLRALYGLVICVLMIVFGAWRTVIPPFSSADFVASYIAIPIFFMISGAYFVSSRGWRPSRWHQQAEKLYGLEAIGPIVVADPNQREPCEYCGVRHRRGQFAWPRGKGMHKQKAWAITEWIWAWLK